MHLTIRMPETEVASCAAALPLLQAAPLTFVERLTDRKVRVVLFPRLPEAIDCALQLLSLIIDFPDLRLTINGRSIASPLKFWTALNCYRESLEEADPTQHCLRRAARVSDAGGCLVRGCLSHCQFICTRCLQVDRSRDAPPLGRQLYQLALQAEVEWCPNLNLRQ